MRAKLFADTAVEWVRPGDIVLTDEGSWLEVDSVTIRREAVDVAGWPEGRRISRRTVVTVEPLTSMHVQPRPEDLADALMKTLHATVQGNLVTVDIDDGHYVLVLELMVGSDDPPMDEARFERAIDVHLAAMPDEPDDEPPTAPLFVDDEEPTLAER